MRDKLVYNVGICQKGKYPVKELHSNIKEYQLWIDMLGRCYNPNCLERRPAYEGCTVEGNFIYYQFFAEWCQHQIGFKTEGWCLDKDILLKDNKVYCEDLCVFVPKELNTLIIKCDRRRGELPIGVTLHKRKGSVLYRARLSVDGKRQHLGVYSTKEEAFHSYKKAKEAHIKLKTSLYEGSLDPRVYKALMEYEVDWED